MPRALWNGSISFGLLNIPVSLVSAKDESPISFDLLDKRDFGRIGYRKYNKKTGREVSQNQIVKGYEYDPDQYVLITDDDFKKANPHATETIDLEDFVDLSEMNPLLFEKPYYLLPGKRGEKGYVLLRNVMKETDKVAIGKIVLHKKQRLVALLAMDKYIICEVLRFANEVLSTDTADLLTKKIDSVKISKRELEMAQELVEGMSAAFQPSKYKDTYHEDMMKLIKAKIRRGGIESPAPEKPEGISTSQVIDLMPLLKRSLQMAHHKPRRKVHRRRAS